MTMAGKAEELRIEAVMLRTKPDLMPWARYILEDMRKEEEAERRERDGKRKV